MNSEGIKFRSLMGLQYKVLVIFFRFIHATVKLKREAAIYRLSYLELIKPLKTSFNGRDIIQHIILQYG